MSASVRLPFGPRPARGRGFTLVELMVSMALGLLLTAGLLAMYVATTRTNMEMAKSNRQIENGRYAIQFLGNDIAHGGYWGGYVPSFDNLATAAVPTDTPTAVPDPCLAYSSANWITAYKNNLLGIPAQVHESVPGSCAAVVADKQDDTDVLVVRHAETCLPGVGGCAAAAAGKLYFQTTFCASDTGSFVLTDYPASVSEVNDASHFNLHGRTCGASDWSPLRRFVSNIYYIRDYSTTAGDGIPTLVRSTFDNLAHQAATPLIEGIEGFHVEFGIDSLSETGAAVDYTAAVAWSDPNVRTTPTNRGDGVPDGDYLSCTDAVPCTATQLANLVAARIYVLARNRETTPGYTDTKTYSLGATTLGPFGDGYKRHVFSTTVRLTNISGRRETP